MRPKPSPFASRSVSLAGPGGVLRAIAPTHGGSRGALVRAGCAPLSLDPPGPEPCRSLTPGFATPGPARPFVPARPWVSHQQIQSPLMGNSIFAFPEAVSKPRGKCRLASALNLRIGRAACRWVFEDPKVLCGFSTARGSAPLTPACSRFTCVCVNNFSPRLAS